MNKALDSIFTKTSSRTHLHEYIIAKSTLLNRVAPPCIGASSQSGKRASALSAFPQGDRKGLHKGLREGLRKGLR